MSPEWTTERRVIVSADRATVLEVVARRLIDEIEQAAGEGRDVHISVTGGSAGIGVLEAVAVDARTLKIDWSRVHFWWSDERFLDASDPQRNDLHAREALLDRLSLPEGNVHRIASADSGRSAEQAAAAYGAELAEHATAGEAGSGAWPSFDVCLLGVGSDAHIASLFPDRPEISITDSAAVVVHDSRTPPPTRVTLTRPVINASQRVWMVLTGAEKASALGLALAGASYVSVPAAGAKGRRSTLFFVDIDAAAEVPEDLIDPD